jgi:uncharacterized repeat protein (TIGR03943 family)
VNRRAQAIVILLVGGVMLRISLAGTYLRYVKAGLHPFLIAAGAVLVIAGIMTLWYQWRGDPGHTDTAAGADHDDEVHEHADHGHDGHGHSGEPRVAWLLLAPVFALVLVGPPALGADAAGRAGTALQQPVSDFPPLPADDPAPLSMLDYASRAVFDEGKSIGTRRVSLRGFVMTGEHGEIFLARMVVSCCAADARPIKVALTGSVPAGLADDSWLEVIGHYSPRTIPDSVNGADIPYLDVDEAKQIDPPAEQYES